MAIHKKWYDGVVEDLIEEIRQYPFLYDKREEEFKNDKLKANVWHQIAANFDRSVKEVHLKWKGLRDTYLRKIKRESSSGSATSGSYIDNWKFFDLMHEVLGPTLPTIIVNNQSNSHHNGSDLDETSSKSHIVLDVSPVDISDQSPDRSPCSVVMPPSPGQNVTPKNRKRKMEEENSEQTSQTFTKPKYQHSDQRSANDDIDGFVKLAYSGLLKIPEKVRFDVILDLLATLNTHIKHYCDDV